MAIKQFNPEVIQFIQDHLNSDPAELVLSAKKYPDLPINEIAVQIVSRKKAKKKLPEWYSNPNVIFPPKQNLEQASSEITAKFKSRWLRGNTIVDLTGGSGIDLFYVSKNFKEAVYVEINLELLEITDYNFTLFGKNIEVLKSNTEEFLSSNTRKIDVIYLDPSRRTNKEKRVSGLEDYQPNVVLLYDKLLDIGKEVVIKTSPMINIKSTLKLLPDTFRIQIVAVDNEVKEVLFYLKKGHNNEIEIEAWNISESKKEQRFIFTYNEERDSTPQITSSEEYLYEPNSAIRKSGAFNLVATRFGLEKLHSNTHLYTSDGIIEGFPGRIFKISEILKPNKKEIRKNLKSGKVNVISKNFPIGANELKKKFRLIDGGDEFLIFCTSTNVGKVAFKCALVS